MPSQLLHIILAIVSLILMFQLLHLQERIQDLSNEPEFEAKIVEKECEPIFIGLVEG